MSSKCDVSNIDQSNLEQTILKAASLAFHKTFPDHDHKGLVRVNQPGSATLFSSAHEQSISAFSEGQESDSSNVNAAITVTQVSGSTESLPISSPGSMISLHFSTPMQEVVS